MKIAIPVAGCLLFILGIAIYGLVLWALHWVLYEKLDLHYWVSWILAFLLASLLMGWTGKQA